MLTLVCDNCGKSFQRARRGKVDHVFCCYGCFQEYKQKTGMTRKIPDFVCQTCGKVFHPQSIKSGRKHYYCSRECAGQVAPEKPCPVCGKMFKVGCDRKKYCSNECRSKAHRKYETQEDARRAQYEKQKVKLRLEREALAPIREAKRAEAAAQRAKAKAEREAAKAVEREQKRQERLHPCEICGEMTDRKKFCSDQCANKAANRQKEISRRHKLRENGKVDYSVTLEKLVKRDRNICHICGGKCDMNDCITVGGTFIAGDNYPSIDHLMPVARGGVHNWDNVKLAHRICNTKKAARRVFETESGQLRFAI